MNRCTSHKEKPSRMEKLSRREFVSLAIAGSLIIGASVMTMQSRERSKDGAGESRQTICAVDLPLYDPKATLLLTAWWNNEHQCWQALVVEIK